MRAGITLVREVEATPAQLCALAAHAPEDFPVFFDSAAQGGLGRYSLLAAYPEASLTLRGDGRVQGRGLSLAATTFLPAFDAWWRSQRGQASVAPADGPDLPFTGGWVVYLSYEFAAQVEPGLRLPPLPAQSICALAVRVRAALVYDHERERCCAVAESGAGALLERLCAAACSSAALGPQARSAQPTVAATRLLAAEQDPQRFCDAVLRAQDYIGAGEIYQANLSREWQVNGFSGESVGTLYERLRAANPAPFAALAQWGALTLLCSSPERLVRVRGQRIDTRPIAGTRARRGAPGADALEQSELLANPKERAEHVMLIDLERNDLGRICRAGSVRVDEFMVTESYPHVHHIVSNVCGELREHITPVDVLRAVFPGGTITGCPKYRCMQIIGELEGEARGAYTGSLGYINLDGSMDFNILIRTATLQGATLSFRAGAGIVADSDWERELAETRAKARGLVRAFAPLQGGG